jgi:hypothetical protein
MPSNTYLRYPLSDDHNHEGIVFFQTIRNNSEALKYQFLSEEDNNSSVTNGVPSTYGDACILYLPAAIQISDAAVYENISLGTMGAVVEKAIGQGAGVMSAGVAAVQGAVSSVGDMLSNQSLGSQKAAATLAVIRGAQKVPGGEFSVPAIKSATRMTLNPNIRAIFNQVPLREFSFTFKLIANSAEEATEIKRIIKYFRKELYPSDIPVGAGGARLSLGYHFPDQFRIEFHHGAPDYSDKWSKDQVATKLKDCYLHGFNAVYNAASMGMHADGNFTEIDITLSFREASTLTKADIDLGY